MGDAILRGGLNQLFCVIPCAGSPVLLGTAVSLAPASPACYPQPSDTGTTTSRLVLVEDEWYLGIYNTMDFLPITL